MIRLSQTLSRLRQRGVDSRSLALTRRRPRLLELLETRRLLAAFQVVTGEDVVNGSCQIEACSLRDAIAAANANPGDDQITFAPSVAGTIDLNPVFGELSIFDSLQIIGPGAGSLIVRGGGAGSNFRLFDVKANAGDVSFSDLTLSGGNLTSGAGAAIASLSEGKLTIVNSVISGNVAVSGGAVYSGAGGDLEISASTLSGNTATYGSGGAIESVGGKLTISNSVVDGNQAYNSGGAIRARNDAGLVLVGSQVTKNRVTYAGYQGGGIHSAAGDLTITGSTISGNTSAGDGGGIYNYRGDVTIADSTISNNSAAYSGGGLLNEVGAVAIDGSVLENNVAGDGFGGAVATDTGSITLTSSAVRNNDAQGDGGGLGTIDGEVQVFASSLSGNTATLAGGAIAAVRGLVLLTNSTVSGNLANLGGGLFTDDGPIRVFSSTLANNVAVNTGGGIGMIADGLGESLQVVNSVIAGNAASQNSDLVEPSDPASSFELVHSLVGDNSGTSLPASNLVDGQPQPDPDGNLVGGTTRPVLEARLEPLTSVAGEPDYHPLSIGSPAIDSGRAERLPADRFDADADGDTEEVLPWDQRGAARIAGNQLDMGAFESFVLPSFDFGDAPQSYPVTLASDGARHLSGELRLGNEVDIEVDGQPSPDSDGDGGDEDGVRLLSDLVVDASRNSTASVQVVASAAARLDAWIDFNRDGDWLDSGEQIAQSISMLAGPNTISFQVPRTAAVGETAARFRLSSSGGLTSTGLAADGEVEDYQVTLLDGGQSPDVTVDLPGDRGFARAENDELVVRDGVIDLFRVRAAAVDRVLVLGGDGDDVFTVGRDPTGTLAQFELDAAGGSNNTLQISGEMSILDLTAGGDLAVANFARIDVSSPEATTVILAAETIDRLSPGVLTVTLSGGEGDLVELADLAGWSVAMPVVSAGTFHRAVTHDSANQVLLIDLPRAWQNPLQPSDVNADGDVTAGDALRIINELARRVYSDPVTKTVNDPLTTNPWPGNYYDQNGDDRITALDALRVINKLSQLSAVAVARGSGEIQLPADGDQTTSTLLWHPVAIDRVHQQQGRLVSDPDHEEWPRYAII